MESLFTCSIFCDILGKVEKISQLLQEKQTNFPKASKLILSLRYHLEVRDSQDFTGLYSEKVEALCSKCKNSLRSVQKRAKKTSAVVVGWLCCDGSEKDLLNFIQSHQHLLFNLRLFTEQTAQSVFWKFSRYIHRKFFSLSWRSIISVRGTPGKVCNRVLNQGAGFKARGTSSEEIIVKRV